MAYELSDRMKRSIDACLEEGMSHEDILATVRPRAWNDAAACVFAAVRVYLDGKNAEVASVDVGGEA